MSESTSPGTAEAFHPATGIRWHIVIAILLIHLGTLLVFHPYFFSWKAVTAFVVLVLLCQGLGISMGVHRLLAHRSFKTYRWIEVVLSWLSSLNWQGGPIRWVARHRIHHSHSDENVSDPHSAANGFFWSHMLWLFVKHPEFDSYKKYSRFAHDLAQDPIHVFIERSTHASQILLTVLLYLWGGWPCVVWGLFARLTWTYHTTWLVNSAAHTWGYRTYDIPDRSRNLWWVALLTYGEGWHNNHHAFPGSARHGLKPWEWDLTFYLLRLLALCKLVWDIRLPPSSTGSAQNETAISPGYHRHPARNCTDAPTG